MRTPSPKSAERSGRSVEFFVPGRPVAKQRPRFANGRVYTPRTTVRYEAKVARCYAEVSSERFDGPVEVSIVVRVKRTKRSKGDQPVGRPDIDNLVKAILDGLRGVAYDDDSQVVGLSARKEYGDEWGVKVLVADALPARRSRGGGGPQARP